MIVLDNKDIFCREVTLTPDEINVVDELIKTQLRRTKPGHELIFPILTDEEVQNYSDDYTQQRLKKLSARLYQNISGLGMFIKIEPQQVILKFEQIDSEKIRAFFLSDPYAFVPLKPGACESHLKTAVLRCIDQELFIDSLLDEEAVEFAKRLGPPLPGIGSFSGFDTMDNPDPDQNKRKWLEVLDLIQEIAKKNAYTIADWCLQKHIPVILHRAEADTRFPMPHPIRYKVQIEKQYRPQLLKALQLEEQQIEHEEIKKPACNENPEDDQQLQAIHKLCETYLQHVKNIKTSTIIFNEENLLTKERIVNALLSTKTLAAAKQIFTTNHTALKINRTHWSFHILKTIAVILTLPISLPILLIKAHQRNTFNFFKPESEQFAEEVSVHLNSMTC